MHALKVDEHLTQILKPTNIMIGRNLIRVAARVCQGGVGRRYISGSNSLLCEKSVKIYFKEGQDGDKIECIGKVGKTVLDVAIDHDIDIEGACGGELACSTCHCILSPELYEQLPEPKEEEVDMLDLAWGLTDTSRLVCQIEVSEELEGAMFVVPDETNEILNRTR